MPDPSGGQPPRFSETFPNRFAAALADAQGTMAGIAASARSADGLIDARSLASLHEIYRLRIELEIETAGVLWRTAEVVCAIGDAIELLGRRRPTWPNQHLAPVEGLPADQVEARRAGTVIADGRAGGRWLRFGASEPAEPTGPSARAA